MVDKLKKAEIRKTSLLKTLDYFLIKMYSSFIHSWRGSLWKHRWLIYDIK